MFHRYCRNSHVVYGHWLDSILGVQTLVINERKMVIEAPEILKIKSFVGFFQLFNFNMHIISLFIINNSTSFQCAMNLSILYFLYKNRYYLMNIPNVHNGTYFVLYNTNRHVWLKALRYWMVENLIIKSIHLRLEYSHEITESLLERSRTLDLPLFFALVSP